MQDSKTKYKTDLRERAKKFSLEIIRLTNNLPNKRSVWIIADQVLRSSMSIGANITEARGSSSRLEYKRFFTIALKSANETIYWLELLRDSELAEKKIIDTLMIEVKEISNMLGASIIKLKSKTFNL